MLNLSLKKNNMKVSIITATYNSEKTISTCLNSIVSQNYSEIECIVIDGKSSDSTIQIIEKFQSKYKFIKVFSEPDNGIYDALNKGIFKASGSIVGFVHSDDILINSDVINNVVNRFFINECDGVYGNVLHVSFNNLNKITRHWKSKPFDSKLIKKGWMPPHPSLFLRREIYQKHGNFNLDFKISADYDFLIRIMNDNLIKLEYINIYTHKMRNGGASNGSLNKLFMAAKEDFKVIKHNNIGGYITFIKKKISKIKQHIIK